MGVNSLLAVRESTVYITGCLCTKPGVEKTGSQDGVLKLHKGVSKFSLHSYFFFVYMCLFMILNCQQQGRHINLIVLPFPVSRPFGQAKQLCEEDTHSCFSDQKAEVQRGSVICPRSHSS